MANDPENKDVATDSHNESPSEEQDLSIRPSLIVPDKFAATYMEALIREKTVPGITLSAFYDEKANDTKWLLEGDISSLLRAVQRNSPIGTRTLIECNQLWKSVILGNRKEKKRSSAVSILKGIGGR